MSYHDKLKQFANVSVIDIFHRPSVNEVENSPHLALKRLYVKMLNESLSKEDICREFILARVPISLIVGLGDLDLVKNMISNGVDVNRITRNTTMHGFKALHMASLKGDVKMAELLLQNDADVNALFFGMTPLMTLFSEINPKWVTDVDVYYQMTRLLVSYGAKILKNHTYYYSFCTTETMVNAVWYANLNTIKLLVNKANGDLTDFIPIYDSNYNLQTCLHSAVLNYQPGVLEYVLEAFKRKNIDIDSCRNYRNETPLVVACCVQNHKAVKILLKSGVDFRIKNSKGLTTFNLLIEGKHIPELAWLYFDLGLDILDPNSISLNQALKSKGRWTKDIVAEIARREMMLADQNHRVFIKNLPEKASRCLSLCKEQLSEMRKLKFYENLSFWDVLSADQTKLTEYAGNSELVDAFFKAKCNGLFSNYCTRIRYRFIEILPRNILMDLSAYVISETVKRPIMHEILLHEVLIYMGDDDFTKILSCCKA